MATPTTNMQLSKPALTESADIGVINSNMDKLDVHRHSGGMDGLAVKAVQAGPQLPAAGIAGQLFVLTGGASPLLYVDSGSSWTPAGGGAGGGETEVVAKSNTPSDGVQQQFNIGSGVAARKVEVRKNGLVKVEGDDYTFNPGNAYVTFVVAPKAGDVVVMKYVPQ